jgi:hypothetical protein
LEPDSSPPSNIGHAAKRDNGGLSSCIDASFAARKSELFAEMFEGEQRWESNAVFRARSIGAGQAAGAVAIFPHAANLIIPRD